MSKWDLPDLGSDQHSANVGNVAERSRGDGIFYIILRIVLEDHGARGPG